MSECQKEDADSIRPSLSPEEMATALARFTRASLRVRLAAVELAQAGLKIQQLGLRMAQAITAPSAPHAPPNSRRIAPPSPASGG
jgi:hypothetical protein